MFFDWRDFPIRYVMAFWTLSSRRPRHSAAEADEVVKNDSTTIIPTYNFINKHLKNYPAPMNLNLSWTFGSLSLMALIIQIVTGFCLTMHYVPHTQISFDSIEHIMRDVNYGYMLRYTHANGASFYFICLYCHVFRSLYYKTFIKNSSTWQVGVVILLLSMATAFLGYVLPWGQMSFWGATVITNLFSVIPFMGHDIVHALWGGYGVGTPTLNRFYSLHFLLPLIVLWLVIIHILLLHEKGSSTPNKSFFVSDVVSFWSFFGIKDAYLLSFGLSLFCLFLIFGPNVLNHPDNYIPADPMQTPAHIVPEWYFLPFYAILRAIPNKIFGVIAMAASILILIVLPLKRNNSKPKTTNTVQFSEKLIFWFFVVDVLYLGYLGGMPIEWPFNLQSFIFCILYFILILAISSDLSRYTIKSTSDSFTFFKRMFIDNSEHIPLLRQIEIEFPGYWKWYYATGLTIILALYISPVFYPAEYKWVMIKVA